jgi:BirA family biotin operon repressor/biotin-[acetyl-CoA-carboxylase] ligase
MDHPQLRSLLSGLPLGGLRYFDRVSSTNEAAMMWLDQAARDYSLVVADEQTAGRGRFNRRWVTNPGAALAFSLIVRPGVEEIPHLNLFSPWGALAVAQALENRLGLHPQIKWPNDVLLSGRKISGILVETSWTGGILDGAILGIGINVSPASVPPPEELLFPAASLEEACGHPLDRWQLLRNVLEALMLLRPLLGTAQFYQAWQERLAFRGEWVIIKTGDGSGPDLHGQVIGINPDGGLRLRPEGAKPGDEFSVQVGDVHLRPEVK